MMILKHIYLYLNPSEYPDPLVTEFGFRTRYICNFIERRLKEEKFNADGFSKICVQGRDEPGEECHIVSENALVPEVHFDRARYENLKDEEHHEFFLEMLERGLTKCQKSYVIPLSSLHSAVEEFRSCRYVNQWEHKKKRLSNGLVVSLQCELTMTEFVLTLSIKKGNELLFERPILNTKPDELIFAHQFKDIAQSDGELVVTNKFGKTLYNLRLSDLTLA
ncbi:hypothetical protein [Bremerella alba]|nr:hypothetical protein [Bremerella alba]